MIIERMSPITGKVRSKDLNITEEQMAEYNNGALVQHAFFHLSPTDREFIMTGICEDEWDMIFAEEEKTG